MTDTTVLAMIKHRSETGDKYSDIAQRFGVSKSNVQRIFSGAGWKHLGFNPVDDALHRAANRSKKGELGSRAKLKPADIHVIRREYAERKPAASDIAFQLAKRFGVHHSSIMGVVNGQTWSHIPIQ